MLVKRHDRSPALGAWTTGGKYHCRIKAYQSSFHMNCYVTDTLKDGYGVYLQAKGVLNYGFDTSSFRFTENVSPGYPVTDHFRGTVDVATTGIDAWRIRVCRDIRHRADPCGRYSEVDV
ncbi:MAG: hypothetical protein H0W51_03195 [Euzebyales bacterium]|nr:hypothetical protein [Euzebyales bacterium]MDQ3342721.1 hypothetical protein [Actinomycetota bacterium]